MKRPLHIGLIMRYGQIWIGGVEYIKNIVLALASLPGDVRSTFKLSLIRGESVDPADYESVAQELNNVYPLDLESLLNPASQEKAPPGGVRRRVSAVLGRGADTDFDLFLRKARIDFVYPFLGHGNKHYRAAAWIYDFQHKYLSHLFSADAIAERDGVFLQVARRADTVAFSSRTAAADFRKFYPEAISKPEILSFSVYPDPAWYDADPRQTQQKYALPDRFFVVCNQFWMHKNHMVILEALKLLHDEEIYPIVACTGNLYDYRQPGYTDTIQKAIRDLGLVHQVKLLGLIPRIDQIQLLRRSLGVIQPSLFEGWSTVVEEARCLAKPILLSDIAVHREQAPPDNSFFDPGSPEGLALLLAEHWKRLLPGPEPGRERAARTKALEDVCAFGYRFLEIARGAREGVD
jgi:glycosyltransferase involved in cell wall biosynthesis